MPAKSLRDIIRDQDGQLLLGGTSVPGVAAQSPSAAAQQGASPDAAKMAGTPASGGAVPGIGAPTPDQAAQAPAPAAPQQPLAAGTEAGAGAAKAQPPLTTQLREVMRMEQAAQQASTAAQADKQAEAARMQTQFGDLGSRIQTLIDRYLPAPAPAPASAPGTPPGDPSAVGTGVAAPPAPLGLLKDLTPLSQQNRLLIQEIARTGGSDPQMIANAVARGIDPWEFVTKPADVASALAAQAAQATPDKIMLDPKTIEGLGYTPASLSAALGVPADQLAGMSLETMQQTMQQKIAAEFSTVRAAASRATDPALGANERAAARAELKQLGAAGVYATEADMSRLEDSIASAGEITFAGETMSIEKALDDEFMTGLIKSYVDSPPDSDARKRLREDSPQLAAWIDQHESALREASLQLEGASTAYTAIQESAASAAQAIAETGLPEAEADALLEMLVPGAKAGLMTEAVDLTKMPGLGLLTGDTTEIPAGFIPTVFKDNFKTVAAISPEAAASLARMTPEQLAAIEAGSPGSDKFGAYVDYLKRWESFEDLDQDDPEQLMDYIFGADVSVASIQKIWAEEAAKARLGAPSAWYKEASKTLDSDGDGQIDDAATMSGTLRDRLGGGAGVTDPSTFDPAKMGGVAPPTGSRGATNPGVSALATAMADGVVTAKEIETANFNSVSADDMRRIDISSFDEKAQGVFKDVLSRKVVNSTAASVWQTMGLGVNETSTQNLGSLDQQESKVRTAMASLATAWAANKNQTPGALKIYNGWLAKLQALLTPVLEQKSAALEAGAAATAQKDKDDKAKVIPVYKAKQDKKDDYVFGDPKKKKN